MLVYVHRVNRRLAKLAAVVSSKAADVPEYGARKARAPKSADEPQLLPAASAPADSALRAPGVVMVASPLDTATSTTTSAAAQTAAQFAAFIQFQQMQQMMQQQQQAAAVPMAFAPVPARAGAGAGAGALLAEQEHV